MSGKVILVGAGPGDLGLLTIKGYDAIKSADVVVYDRLVSSDILKLIPQNAEKINAGKKSANHLIPQEEINKILLDKALQGKTVVRLKGGDCFLFGRGGEELELLEKNNIQFEVIPGITSALSVPAYAGIPVTHRDFVSSVHIITGHQKKDEKLKINYKACVEMNGTLVFLMGVANLKEIIDNLIQNGLSQDMPCAVIEQGTRPNQRKVIAKAKDIFEKCNQENIKSPAIIVVGQVCSLSDKFDWFDNLILKGKKIVVTRPKDRIGVLSNKLKNLGADVIEYPCIETISCIDDKLMAQIQQKVKEFDWIVFTSPAGVKALFEKMNELRLDARLFGNKKIAVIGSGTEKELQKYNVFADVMPEKYDGKNLGIILGEKAKGQTVLILRAEIGAEELPNELDKANIKYEDLAIYKTVFKSDENKSLEEKINNNEIDFVTFTSASTVKAFTDTVKADYSKFIGVSIGEKTSKTAKEFGIKIIESEKSTIDSLVDRLIKRLTEGV